MNARLLVSAATARRLGSAAAASPSAAVPRDAAAGQTKSITVRLSRSARTKLSRARSADVTLEVTVNGAGTASRRATRRVTLG